ncbi:MAG TPA: nuclear transport factor 2 family protein [Stellaceae bacterium]|nr:nuclear transport factor 2 family protein [Stellaceae bacterium]
MVKMLGMAVLGILMALGRPARAADEAQMAANKAAVVAFYQAALNDKDFDKAQQYLGARYTQHNPTAEDGPEGLRKFIGFLKSKFPMSHNDIRQVFVDGDYVVLHVLAVREPTGKGRAIVDIFKLDGGKIVEHWDVIQEVPDTAANPNGMF